MRAIWSCIARFIAITGAFTLIYPACFAQQTTPGYPGITEYPLGQTVNHGDKWPMGIIAGPDGALWLTSVRSGISRMSTSGVLTFFPTSIPNNVPASICTGPDGALWFTLAGMNSTDNTVPEIGRMTTSGALSFFTIPGLASNAIAGTDGAVWFTEPPGKIGRITS